MQTPNRDEGSAAARPLRRVLFFGKSMSRTRCSGALVDALEEHGLEVRWRNLATVRRWVGPQMALRLARAEFRRYRPDLVFVFFRDLPAVLLQEFGQECPTVLWVEEALENLDSAIVDYLAKAHLVCMSNASRYAWLKERGLENLTFLMSGFSPRFHHPAPPQVPRRDVAFIGGPGRHGQRAAFLARVSERFSTQIFGMHWDRWRHVHKNLDIRGTVDNKGYGNVCATSRILLGLNEVNDNEYYFSNRTFLTMACGGFHLTHYVPRLENVFRNGEHLAWFRDEDEALELIEHWLARPEERARVAAGGHAEAMNHHRYFHRVARILQILAGDRPESTLAVPRPQDSKVLPDRPTTGVNRP